MAYPTSRATGRADAFEDRREAGIELAARLSKYRGRHDVIVLALPRGGVPVAFEIAEALDAPLEIFVVRKLGMPGHPEFAIGAIASGGVRVLNEETVQWYAIPASAIEAVASRELVEALRGAAQWFEAAPDGFRAVLDAIGDARLVLIGEASHGTHEFYEARAELTKALIVHAGFNVVAVEADWPDAYRVNRWVRHASGDADASAALADFTRFPRWMWRNGDVVRFLEWLRDHNRARDAAARVGFYGLDLYSLHTSIQAVLGYLAKVDPDAAKRARRRYGCFEDFADDPQAYGYAATVGP